MTERKPLAETIQDVMDAIAWHGRFSRPPADVEPIIAANRGFDMREFAFKFAYSHQAGALYHVGPPAGFYIVFAYIEVKQPFDCGVYAAEKRALAAARAVRRLYPKEHENLAVMVVGEGKTTVKFIGGFKDKRMKNAFKDREFNRTSTLFRQRQKQLGELTIRKKRGLS